MGAVRRCAECETPVTNLSLLTEAAARAFLETARGQCIAYRFTPDGTIVFADALARRRPGWAAAGAALLVAACAPGVDAPTKPAAEAKVDPRVVAQIVEREEREACRQRLGAERREEYRAEMRAEAARADLDCDVVRQLLALGYYVGEPPEGCSEPPDR